MEMDFARQSLTAGSHTCLNFQSPSFQQQQTTRIEMEIHNFSVFIISGFIIIILDYTVWPVNSPIFPPHTSFFLDSLLNCLQTYPNHRGTDCFIKVAEISAFSHIDFSQLRQPFMLNSYKTLLGINTIPSSN
jgi:hypothetical protein